MLIENITGLVSSLEELLPIRINPNHSYIISRKNLILFKFLHCSWLCDVKSSLYCNKITDGEVVQSRDLYEMKMPRWREGERERRGWFAGGEFRGK